MIFSSLSIMLLFGQSPSMDDLEVHFRAMPWDVIAPTIEPLSLCLREKIENHIPNPDEIGKTDQAFRFLNDQYQICGLERTEAEVVKLATARDKQLTNEKAKERAAAILSIVTISASSLTIEKFKLKPASVTKPTFTIPRPSGDENRNNDNEIAKSEKQC